MDMPLCIESCNSGLFQSDHDPFLAESGLSDGNLRNFLEDYIVHHEEVFDPDQFEKLVLLEEDNSIQTDGLWDDDQDVTLDSPQEDVSGQDAAKPEVILDLVNREEIVELLDVPEPVGGRSVPKRNFPVSTCKLTQEPIPKRKKRVGSAHRSIPTSPDRSTSCSPFAPSTADVPIMPQPASMSQCGRTTVGSAHRSIPTSPDRSTSCSPFAPSTADVPIMLQPASMSQCGRSDHPAGPTVNGTFTITTCAPSHFPAISSTVASTGPTGRTSVSHALASLPSSDCGRIQVMPTLTRVPQHLICLPHGSHVSYVITCSASPPQISPQIVSPFNAASTPGFVQHTSSPMTAFATTYMSAVGPAHRSIPTSPDRSTSCSPFAPSTADVPIMPQPASMSQCGRTGSEAFSKTPACPSITFEPTLQKPTCVEAFQVLLKEHWKLMATTPECHLDSLHTDVDLVQSRAESKLCKVAAKAVEKEVTIYDVSEREENLVERRNLFQGTRDKLRETKAIAILGNSGMGKSVLVKKICQDWTMGAYPEFSIVFCFQCRRLNRSGQRYSLKDMLFELSAKPKEKCEEVFKYILCNPGEVLLIFDGFDEFHEFDGLVHCSASSSSKQSFTVKELFSGIFLKKLLRGCTILITSRPKDTFHQYLAKADRVLELVGFSPHHVDEYMKKHFEKFPFGRDCVKQIKESHYLFSCCYIPLMCRMICVFCETVYKTEDKKLPSTLTSLFVKIIKHNLGNAPPHPATKLTSAEKLCFTKLACLALTLGEKHQHALMENTFPSADVQEFALKYGFMETFSIHSDPLCKDYGSVFSSCILQRFLVALHLLLSKTVRGKTISKFFSLEPRKKKLQAPWLDIVRRFLTGLIFTDGGMDLGFPKEKKVKSLPRKQRRVSDYLENLNPHELSPGKLLELCHCVYESQDMDLLVLTASKLKGDFSFQCTHLTPPDVHVLRHTLRRSSNTFSLDLRNSGIQIEDLKQLVVLHNIESFRASLSDTVRLWKSLQQTGEVDLLALSVKKFTIEPYKAKSMKDIADLSALVQIQANLSNCNICEVPAVKTLKELEFALGPVSGLDGFLKLVRLLPAFSSLQHLDLDGLSGNNIGDKGAEKLAEVFPELPWLETLDLSQNGISDLGVKKMAHALPSLACLQKLSLYNNHICDDGAETIADTLPLLSSLTMLALQFNRITDIGAQKLTESLRKCPTIKSLSMWNSTIPHGVLERLQQQDSRIS
ncbi:MHC class II transactivator isoform X3 [Ambystoma mexicanum]|uniref:MHC class II transactivator isoform X3 n=1 Tax=Ambystoma mexicanum TaxID=8296 RepID=UPI0037E74A9A